VSAAVDWADVRRRLDAAAARHDTPEDARRVLEERARRLARPPAEAAAEEPLEVLVFARGGERFAVETRHVVEVFRLRALTPLPGAEARVAGLTAWRGEILAVHDLRPGGAAGAEGAEPRVVVLGGDDPAFGLVADAVEGLLLLAPADVLPLPPAARPRDPLRGVAGDGLLVLDAEALVHPYSEGGPP
jgi:purine-binding chemotaxis protein CheW